MISKKSIILISAIVLIGVMLFFGLKQHHQSCLFCAVKSLNIEVVKHYIQSFGPLAIVIYILLYIVNTFSPFLPPIAFLSLSAGAIFGPVMGTVALTLGTFCGTTTAFFTARYVARSWVEGLLKDKGRELDAKLSSNGFFILLPMRLIGFPPYGIIDFICGLSKMKYLDFATATFLGGIPWIIAQVFLADRLAVFSSQFVWNDLSTWYDPVLIGLFIFFVLMIVVTGKIVKKKQEVHEKI